MTGEVQPLWVIEVLCSLRGVTVPCCQVHQPQHLLTKRLPLQRQHVLSQSGSSCHDISAGAVHMSIRKLLRSPACSIGHHKKVCRCTFSLWPIVQAYKRGYTKPLSTCRCCTSSTTTTIPLGRIDLQVVRRRWALGHYQRPSVAVAGNRSWCNTAKSAGFRQLGGSARIKFLTHVRNVASALLF